MDGVNGAIPALWETFVFINICIFLNRPFYLMFANVVGSVNVPCMTNMENIIQ